MPKKKLSPLVEEIQEMIKDAKAEKGRENDTKHQKVPKKKYIQPFLKRLDT